MPFQNKCKAIKRLKNEKKKNYGWVRIKAEMGLQKPNFSLRDIQNNR